MSAISTTRFAAAIVEAVDTMGDDFDLVDFLQTVSARAASLVEGTTVGLIMADANGELRFVAASHPDPRTLELCELQRHEGPGHEAFTTGSRVVATGLTAAERRWPRFAPAAVAAGFQTAHALPMRARQQVIGALNVLSVDGLVLEDEDLHVVQALADIVTIALLQQRALQRARQVTDQLQQALTSRIVIEQAKGTLAQLHGIGVDEAFERLRRHARSHNQRLADLARAVVSDPQAKLRIDAG